MGNLELVMSVRLLQVKLRSHRVGSHLALLKLLGQPWLLRQRSPPLQMLRLKMTCALKMIFSPAAMTSRQYR